MSDLNSRHFDKLVECCRAILTTPPEERKSPWIGRSTRAWLTSVQKGQRNEIIYLSPQEFCEKALDRGQLCERVARSRDNLTDKALRDLVIDILAWGGMGPKSARAALSNWNDWKSPCIELAQGCDAGHAYDQFHSLQLANKLPGMRAAYYTKLIHFLGKGDGLIMDQWTSRSINLLFGKNIIVLDSGKYVGPKNDRAIYEAYNEAVSAIAQKLTDNLSVPVDSSQAEEYLFSFTTDPRKQGKLSDDEHRMYSAWRRYVEENHRP